LVAISYSGRRVTGTDGRKRITNPFIGQQSIAPSNSESSKSSGPLRQTPRRCTGLQEMWRARPGHFTTGFHRPVDRRDDEHSHMGGPLPWRSDSLSSLLTLMHCATPGERNGLIKRSLPAAISTHAAARSSLSAPRATILSASSGNGRCSAFASSRAQRSCPPTCLSPAGSQ
jgi:hypothetical protein